MTEQSSRHLERLRREALAWLLLLTSGAATDGDLAALDQWRAASPAHRAAFGEANALWDRLGDVSRLSMSQDRKHKTSLNPARRTLLVGGACVATAGLAGLALAPPLELWPSLNELRGDYRTATGERRQVNLAADATLDLNTRTSIVLSQAQRNQFELLAGEAMVTKPGGFGQPVRIKISSTTITLADGGCNLRNTDALVTATCTAGRLNIDHPASSVVIERGQQARFDNRKMMPPVTVDTAVITAWQNGLLVFRDAPLSEVVAEVNRYRPGRIILIDQRLAKRRVVAGFQIAQVGDVVGYISTTFKASVATLPGGIVLLG